MMRVDQNNAKKSVKVASLVSQSISIKGDVSGQSELHVDGQITGDVAVDRLLVGEGGRIEGAITADGVDVRGMVVGSIKARHVHLRASATMMGDITHEQLTIDAGAGFEGRSLKLQSAAVHMLADASGGESKGS